MSGHLRLCAYHRPRTLVEAWRFFEEVPNARWVAGGTDLLLRLRRHADPPAALVSLRGIDEIRGVVAGRERIQVGAGATLSEVLGDAALGDAAPALAAAIEAMGSPQIRNAGTIGGNLCNASPCADTAPPLLALDAEVSLARPSGTRSVPLAAFFTGPGTTTCAPGEVLATVQFRRPAPGTRAIFLKQGRNTGDLALASLAVLLVVEGGRCRLARVAAGAVAPTPLRLRAVEALLEAEPLRPALIAELTAAAQAAVSPIDDLRASARYRRSLVAAFLRRALAELVGVEGRSA